MTSPVSHILSLLTDYKKSADGPTKKELATQVLLTMRQLGAAGDAESQDALLAIIGANEQDNSDPKYLSRAADKAKLLLPSKATKHECTQSALSWLPSESKQFDLRRVSKVVDMNGFEKTTADANQYILLGGGVGGCLFIAAFGKNDTACLGHIDPQEVTANQQFWLDRIITVVGNDAEFYAASPSLDTRYNQDFITALGGRGLILRNTFKGSTLAINAKTRAVLWDISPLECKL